MEEDEFVVMLKLAVVREGLISWMLFFLGRPVPLERAEEVRGFVEVRTGDESLEACGESDAEAARAGRVLFELRVDDAAGSVDL